METLILPEEQTILSIVGMGKNTGKTVTLNGLIKEAHRKGSRLGLTSVGRDGEKTDLVTLTKKPQIYAPAGTLVATASEALTLSQATIELLEATSFATPMGNLMIGRVVDGGWVQLAGPSTACQLPLVSERMLQAGARLVLVDGAIDRRSAANPCITQATILATGAVISPDMEQVILKTRHQVRLFQLKAVEEPILRAQAESLLRQRSYAIIDEDGQIRLLPLTTALNAGNRIADAITPWSRYLVLSGSLVTKTLQAILAVKAPHQALTLLLADPTRIFIPPGQWNQAWEQGLQVKVLHPIQLLAVTVNPTSPKGYSFPREVFLNRMKEALSPLPVVDFIREEALYGKKGFDE